jgi:hypothetical protein
MLNGSLSQIVSPYNLYHADKVNINVLKEGNKLKRIIFVCLILTDVLDRSGTRMNPISVLAFWFMCQVKFPVVKSFLCYSMGTQTGTNNLCARY